MSSTPPRDPTTRQSAPEDGPQLSVIVPCFNEKDAIAATIAELDRILEGRSHEILVIDDGSTDGSHEIIEQAAGRFPRLRAFRHERNRGYGAALKTGVRRSRGELVAITDADGTYPNERLPELVDACRHADMVVGSRTAEGAEHSFLRSIPKAFLRRYSSWLAGSHIPDMNSGLRVMRRSVVTQHLGILPEGFSFTTTITIALLRSRREVLFVPIDYKHRIGRSKIQPVRDTLRFTQLIVRTGMYFAPLRVLVPPGLLLFLGFCASVVYDLTVERNLTDKTVLLLVSSGQVLALALLADMIDKRSSR
jgi:glycosyltransferase involved in cell wall biosynthesis